jgi:nicotinamidase-related amidase
MATGLLLIDIQNDYFPGGTMELVGADAAAMLAAQLLTTFRQKSWPVFHIQHIATRPNATFFLPNTPGAEIHALVQPRPGDGVIVKHFPNSFRETDLLDTLRKAQITDLVIAGMMTHMCVDTTVRAAADLGFVCSVAHDACATRDLVFNEEKINARQVQGAYMAALNGSFAAVKSTQALCV